MTQTTHVVGIDPGLVDTGAVRLLIQPDQMMVESRAFKPADLPELEHWVRPMGLDKPHIFVEKYRPRQNMGTDVSMVKLEQDITEMLRSRGANRIAMLQSNVGIKQVVSQPLMEVLQLWRFSTATHHQDLRSAARIALLGMMKDDQLNTVLANVVWAHLNGKAPQITHLV